jgi:hypothetical protein
MIDTKLKATPSSISDTDSCSFVDHRVDDYCYESDLFTDDAGESEDEEEHDTYYEEDDDPFYVDENEKIGNNMTKKDYIKQKQLQKSSQELHQKILRHHLDKLNCRDSGATPEFSDSIPCAKTYTKKLLPIKTFSNNHVRAPWFVDDIMLVYTNRVKVSTLCFVAPRY